MKKKYIFKGYAKDGFGNVVAKDLVLETVAQTEDVAKRNFKAQVCRELGLRYSAKIDVIGKIEKVW